jgi:hypothetical protein
VLPGEGVTAVTVAVAPLTSAPLSMRAYARHRQVSAVAVLRAIRKGRLQASLVVDERGKAKIANVALADEEWAANTDLTKAPTYVKARAGTPRQAAATDASKPPHLSGDMSLTAAVIAEKYWSAKRKELDYLEQAGQLVDAQDVANRIVTTFTECRTKLLGIPGKVKTALPHLGHTDIATVDRLIREALEDLAAEPIRTPGSAAA